MKTAVIVNQSTGYLTVDVCNAFARKYDRVILLAGKVAEFNRALDPNIEVVNICPYDKSSKFKRLKSWIIGYSQIKKFLKKNPFPKDVLYFTNPPMSYFAADKFADRYAVVVYDLYPDVLSNIKCPKFIVNKWAAKNRKIFGKASGIITLSDGMKLQTSKYCSEKLIKVVPNWSTSEDVERVKPEENPFVKEHNLEGKFVVLYSGNIGYTHNVETIIDVACHLKDDPRFAFVIIGNGGKKTSLIEKASQAELTNVIFSDFLPVDQLKYSLSSADIGVVTLTPETAQSSVPSKTYNLLAYGIPILNIAPTNSELGGIIARNKCGASFEASDRNAICNFLEKCRSDSDYYTSLKASASQTSRLFTLSNATLYPQLFNHH